VLLEFLLMVAMDKRTEVQVCVAHHQFRRLLLDAVLRDGDFLLLNLRSSPLHYWSLSRL
jgi:hypothetical protein